MQQAARHRPHGGSNGGWKRPGRRCGLRRDGAGGSRTRGPASSSSGARGGERGPDPQSHPAALAVLDCGRRGAVLREQAGKEKRKRCSRVSGLLKGMSKLAQK